MYGCLYPQSPVGLPGRLSLSGGAVAIDLTDADVRVLQEAAVEANRRFAKP